MRISVLRIVFALLLVVTWQVFLEIYPSPAVPQPLEIAKAGYEFLRDPQFYASVANTLERFILGLAFAAILAAIVAAFAATMRPIYQIISVPIDVVRAIPPIAWTPLAIVWFGLGSPPAIFIVFLGAFFPLLLAVTSAITNVDIHFVRAARLMGANKLQIARHVIFPSALPLAFVGLRTAIIVGWFNIIAAELIGVSSGLGYEIQLNRILLFNDRVFFLVFVVGALGYATVSIAGIVERIVVPWHDPTGTKRWQMSINRGLAKTLSLWRTKRLRGAQLTKSRRPEPLKISGLGVNYRAPSGQPIVVLSNFSLTVGSGEIVGLMGRNGTGKTTLLNSVAGFEENYVGTIQQGASLGNEIKSIGYLFQSSVAYPWYTVRENLLLACLLGHRSTELVDQYLRDAGLDEFQDAFPSQLSGGMAQKLGIVRTLLREPEILLMDEPFSNLDVIAKLEILTWIKDYVRNHSSPTLWVTHDLDEAIESCDRVLVLQRGAPPSGEVHVRDGGASPENLVRVRESLFGLFDATRK